MELCTFLRSTPVENDWKSFISAPITCDIEKVVDKIPHKMVKPWERQPIQIGNNPKASFRAHIGSMEFKVEDHASSTANR